MVRLTRMRVEISRKALHLCAALIPLSYLVLPRGTVLWILGALLLFAICVEILRWRIDAFHGLYRSAVGFMMRKSEWDRVTGATYVLLAAWLSIALFPQPIAIASLLVMSLADTAASLVGLRFGRSKFLGKSLAGSSAFLLVAATVLMLSLPAPRGVTLMAALVATVIEALPSARFGPIELNDNLLVPLGTGALLLLLT